MSDNTIDTGIANPTYLDGTLASDHGSTTTPTRTTRTRRGLPTGEEPYRRMSDDSIPPRESKYWSEVTMVSRRHLCVQYVVVILLAVVIALVVSCTVAFLVKDEESPVYEAIAAGELVSGADQCVKKPCKSGSSCIPTLGGYFCAGAQTEYAGCAAYNGGCEDRCVTSQGSVQCFCDSTGFQLAADNKTCTDIDECTGRPCSSMETCINAWGSFHCVKSEDLPYSGSTYTRWGRSTCPDDIATELLYSGYTAGQFYNQEGGASNYLCLPLNPEWGDVAGAENKTSKRNFISGAEFETDNDEDSAPFSSENTQVVNSQDAPCAVCRATTRSTVVMTAARKSCPAGWLLEYHGYLMSEYKTDSRTQFICVDHAPEALVGGHENLDGVGLFLVQAQIGSLKSPPYEPSRDFVCVVCSR